MLERLYSISKGSQSINFVMLLVLAIVALALIIVFVETGLGEGQSELFDYLEFFESEADLEDQIDKGEIDED